MRQNAAFGSSRFALFKRHSNTASVALFLVYFLNRVTNSYLFVLFVFGVACFERTQSAKMAADQCGSATRRDATVRVVLDGLLLEGF